MNHLEASCCSCIWVGVLSLAGVCHAGLYTSPTDEELVQQSDFIVVGHLEDGSIARTTNDLHGTSATNGWKHHEAVLIVDKTLKGDLKEKRLRLLILGNHLDVSVGTPAERERFWQKNLGFSPGKKYPPDFPTNTVEVFCSNSSIPGFVDFPLVEDARTHNLWFLRDVRPEPSRKADEHLVWINEPENLQPIAFKDYFVAYLSNDPERSIRPLMEKMPAIAERGQAYLDRKEISRILVRPPDTARLQGLIPLFLKYPHRAELRKGLIECGQSAGPALLKPYEQTTSASVKEEIESIWVDVGYEDGINKAYEESRGKARRRIAEKTDLHNQVPEHISTNTPSLQH